MQIVSDTIWGERTLAEGGVFLQMIFPIKILPNRFLSYSKWELGLQMDFRTGRDFRAGRPLAE